MVQICSAPRALSTSLFDRCDCARCAGNADGGSLCLTRGVSCLPLGDSEQASGTNECQKGLMSSWRIAAAGAFVRARSCDGPRCWGRRECARHVINKFVDVFRAYSPCISVFHSRATHLQHFCRGPLDRSSTRLLISRSPTVCPYVAGIS